MRVQTGVDAGDDGLIARPAYRAEATVELSLRHEFGQVTKIGQEGGVAPGGSQFLPDSCRVRSGGGFAEANAGTPEWQQNGVPALRLSHPAKHAEQIMLYPRRSPLRHNAESGLA